MISGKTLDTIEFDKILTELAGYAVLERTRKEIFECRPVRSLAEAENLLDKTEEAGRLFFEYDTGGIYFCRDITEELKRADLGGTLNNAELLSVAENLKSARILRRAILSVKDEKITLLPQIVSRLYENAELEDEITSKIVSEDEISDNASDKLYSIRKNIRELNAKIRDKLNSYIRGGNNKYLQDNVVTLRQDRYVIPVKSEYRSRVRGFIHDQSASGATVFIEPEQVMEYNNELKRARFEEADEIYRILSELSEKVSFISGALKFNYENLSEADGAFARAMYGHAGKCVRPVLNDRGFINIVKGRHPLIPGNKVVPVSLSLGKNCHFLLITGPNTGGKTVTLKMAGLFCAMAMSGIFVPAGAGSELSVFNGIYCDIGDEQSIEQNLSTFSSHIKNIVSILAEADNKSLVLIDEIGAGTDPEEGSALALAVLEKFLSIGCFGIVTTHYSALKEYAMNNKKILNASMEFDAATLKPLYKINIGVPGSSNAIDIAKTLGLGEDIIKVALSNLSEGTVNFEKALKSAEESRRKYEKLSAELNTMAAEKRAELDKIRKDREETALEKERIYRSARLEIKRLVAEKADEAEEIVAELKNILRKTRTEDRDVFRASELKNKLNDFGYIEEGAAAAPAELIKAGAEQIKRGVKVYIRKLGATGIVTGVKPEKKEAEVLVGDIKTVVKFGEIFNAEEQKPIKDKIDVKKAGIPTNKTAQLNVIGKTTLEAVSEVENFIDNAVISGVSEITVIHGVGSGALLRAVREYLKTDKNVAEFRRGRYGEGENGVTVIKLK